MITVDGQPTLEADGRFKYSFQGNANDTPPVKEYEGHKLANGSQFLVMGDMSLKMYDQENEKWV